MRVPPCTTIQKDSTLYLHIAELNQIRKLRFTLNLKWNAFKMIGFENVYSLDFSLIIKYNFQNRK